jgi:hypothetical protein
MLYNGVILLSYVFLTYVIQCSCLIQYFAYGSNLKQDILEHRTGGCSVVPGKNAVLEHYQLVFNVPGPLAVPIKVPSAASVEPTLNQFCHGCLYELTLAQFTALLASEGYPIGYKLETVSVIPYDNDKRRKQRIRAYTLRSGNGLVSGKPSLRYKNLLIDGARARGLDEQWQLWLADIDI